MRFSSSSAEDAGPDEADRVHPQKSAQPELAPNLRKLRQREIWPMALGSEPCCMNRTDRCAATDLKGRLLELTDSIQNLQDRAEQAFYAFAHSGR